MIRDHYAGLRAQTQYAKSYIRVFIEANMSFVDAGRIADQITEPCFKPLEVVRKDKKGRYGVWTNKDSKQGYCEEIRRAVSHMRVASVLVSSKPQEDVRELCAQLGQFRSEIVARASESATALFNHRVLTGKSAGQKDDLWMALGIALYHMYRSFNDYRFVDMCCNAGLLLN